MSPRSFAGVVAAATAIAAVMPSEASASGSRAPVKETQPMSTPPSGSRPPAPAVSPIEHNGVRYEQDRFDTRQGDQPGGYLAAIDVKTGERLWRLKVYNVPDNRAAGLPSLPRNFRAMRIVPGAQALEIENEAGGVYRVDLATRTSQQTGGPPETGRTSPAAPTKPKP